MSAGYAKVKFSWMSWVKYEIPLKTWRYPDWEAGMPVRPTTFGSSIVRGRGGLEALTSQ